MGIGMLVLYAALAVVGLWLIAELLLQSRAPLHWRALALGGFLLVVAGMAVHSAPVIGGGAVGFAVGQVLVTTSVKRGGKPSWSLRRGDGELPGPLAKVPLLAAATSGTEAVAVAEPPRVGEVGPIEVTEPQAELLPEPDQTQLPADDGDFGIYETGYPQPEQQQPQLQQQFAYGYYQPEHYEQQPGYGYYEQQQPQYQGYEGHRGYGYDQQQWQPQAPAYDPVAYQPEYGSQPEYAGQPEYGAPGIPQQPSPEYYQQYQPQYQQPQEQGSWQGWQ
ncbi:hypothetical protein LN042_17085 [Kitasatospora sp. RB6PN24]|uniref:hypothetical protein n=1 Tax=Kitasatospora humi TaxID=2893891 RepID=UPI001E50B3F5|nr:hypothetical protein [Kitasatospora humi]MCC9308778.1 hypothetical protein [Kitasatospora humi]